jgi:hypothetical protein
MCACQVLSLASHQAAGVFDYQVFLQWTQRGIFWLSQVTHRPFSWLDAGAV